jgi:hypothetical protein
LSLIGHGTVQTRNAQSALMGITEHRKQPDNQRYMKEKYENVSPRKIMIGCEFEPFGIQI